MFKMCCSHPLPRIYGVDDFLTLKGRVSAQTNTKKGFLQIIQASLYFFQNNQLSVHNKKKIDEIVGKGLMASDIYWITFTHIYLIIRYQGGSFGMSLVTVLSVRLRQINQESLMWTANSWRLMTIVMGTLDLNDFSSEEYRAMRIIYWAKLAVNFSIQEANSHIYIYIHT